MTGGCGIPQIGPLRRDPQGVKQAEPAAAPDPPDGLTLVTVVREVAFGGWGAGDGRGKAVTPRYHPHGWYPFFRWRKGAVDMSERLLSSIFMAALPWVYVATWAGAAYGGGGYDPASTPEMLDKQLSGIVSLAGFAVVMTVVQTLLMPVFVRVNEGQWDWRKARTVAGQLAIFVALGVALMFAVVGGYRLAGGVTGGWPGGLRDGALGALIGASIGAALGVLGSLVLARLGLAERSAAHHQKAEPRAAPDPPRPTG